MVDEADRVTEETSFGRFDIVLVKLNPTVGLQI
jgi:hypothetical protein